MKRILRKKRSYRRAAMFFLLVFASPVLYKTAVDSFPFLESAAVRIATWSAGLDSSEEAAEESDSSSPDVFLPDSGMTGLSFSGEDSSSSSAEEPSRPSDAGEIIRKQYKSAASSIQFQTDRGGWIKNLTSHTKAEVLAQIRKGPAFSIDAGEEPQVLIMHTHTTEGYERQALDWYDPDFNSRTTNEDYNVCLVGDAIEKELKNAGIGVIHDTTLHDYPKFPGCYDRSAVTVSEYLKKYPSIKVVLDVHRDAIEQKDGSRIAPVASINGKNAAQVMIISGCDDGTMDYPNFFENLKFAALLQDQLDTDYPGLTRPLLFDYRKYNQHLTTGSILLEMGGHANSLDEAVYAGELVGKSLARALASLRKGGEEDG